MKNKILIIGQAPPAVKQWVPYDTTLLYEMLSWIGITKEDAQEIFEFEAVSNVFPGINKNGGHLSPSQKDMETHWQEVLASKVHVANRIIILGNVAKKFMQPKINSNKAQYIELIHPSKRNYSKIMADKEEIINKLTFILTE